MSRNKHLNHIAVILLLIAVAFVADLFLFPEKLGIKTDNNEVGYEKYFDEDAVMTVEIELDDAKWQEFLENGREEEYIPCNIVINGERMENVAIRTKGNSSLQQVAASDSDRFSFKIEFDHYVDNQTFHGLDKMVLNNMFSDATYMKEFMSYEIFEKLGVNVPLRSYAQITVNGKNSGLYLAIEAMEESYATRVYGSDYGQLYRPESTDMDAMAKNMPNLPGGFDQNMSGYFPNNEDGKKSLDGKISLDGKESGNSIIGRFGGKGAGGTDLVYTDDEISSYSAVFGSAVFDATDVDFKRVINALKNLNNATDLEKYINVDATLRYFAAQTFIINFDSYYGSLQHNYYLYEKDGQLTMLPWDLNLAFAGFETIDTSSAVNYPIDTPLSGVEMQDRPMLSKLLEVPEYMDLYHEFLDELVSDYFDNGEYSAKIAATNELIHSYVEEDATAFYTPEEYKAAVPVIDTFGMLRAESIAGQLDGTIPSTEEGQATDASALVDTGDLDLTTMGSQGGNGAWGPNMPNRPKDGNRPGNDN